MGYKISKELFEAVMEVKTLNGFTHIPSMEEYLYQEGLSYTTKQSGGFITINDFFFRCKEFALEKGYIIIVFPVAGLVQEYSYAIYESNRLKEFTDLEHFISSKVNIYSEQQAIFDATQYILNILKKNTQ